MKETETHILLLAHYIFATKSYSPLSSICTTKYRSNGLYHIIQPPPHCCLDSEHYYFLPEYCNSLLKSLSTHPPFILSTAAKVILSLAYKFLTQNFLVVHTKILTSLYSLQPNDNIQSILIALTSAISASSRIQQVKLLSPHKFTTLVCLLLRSCPAS